MTRVLRRLFPPGELNRGRKKHSIFDASMTDVT